MSAPPATAIIGGGIIGLAIGWRLAQAGVGVEIFEREAAGRGASWAAAGMLAAGVESEPGEAALCRLNRLGQALWPDFAAELEAAAGLGVGLRREGTIEIALTRDDAAKLRHVFDFQRAQGVTLEWLTPAEARAREPHLGTQLAGAVFSPHDHQVDNRAVVVALRRAFLAAGGVLREATPVAAVVCAGDRVAGLELGTGEFPPCHRVVLAAGPWSSLLAGLPEAARPAVRPIKGQMLALGMDPAAPLLSHVLWTPRVYLVPRGDGRLIVGATTEERGFDTAITAGGMFSLLEGAWRALPAIEELPIIETWVGFRPGSRDDAPLLGPHGPEGLVFATGHHRNGILLAPLTAELIARYLLEGAIDPAMHPFLPDRFAAREVPVG